MRKRNKKILSIFISLLVFGFILIYVIDITDYFGRNIFITNEAINGILEKTHSEYATLFIAKRKDKRIIKPLITVILDKEYDEVKRIECVQILADKALELKKERKIVSILKKVMQQNDSWVIKAAAATSLLRIQKDDEAILICDEALKRGVAQTPSWMFKHTQDIQLSDERLKEYLIKGAKYPDERVRIACTGALFNLNIPVNRSETRKLVTEYVKKEIRLIKEKTNSLKSLTKLSYREFSKKVYELKRVDLVTLESIWILRKLGDSDSIVLIKNYEKAEKDFKEMEDKILKEWYKEEIMKYYKEYSLKGKK